MKSKKVLLGALVSVDKRNALNSRLAARGESFKDWLERMIEREVKWSDARTMKGSQ